MSYVFFQDVLKQLGRKLHYDAIVNYAGNSFAKKSWEMISEANPLKPAAPDGGTHSGAMQNLAAFFGSAAKATKKNNGGIGYEGIGTSGL